MGNKFKYWSDACGFLFKASAAFDINDSLQKIHTNVHQE